MPNTNCKAQKGKAYFRGALLLPTTVTALNTTHSKIHVPEGERGVYFPPP